MYKATSNELFKPVLSELNFIFQCIAAPLWTWLPQYGFIWWVLCPCESVLWRHSSLLPYSVGYKSEFGRKQSGMQTASFFDLCHKLLCTLLMQQNVFLYFRISAKALKNTFHLKLNPKLDIAQCCFSKGKWSENGKQLSLIFSQNPRIPGWKESQGSSSPAFLGISTI